jgi:hypothetical protein
MVTPLRLSLSIVFRTSDTMAHASRYSTGVDVSSLMSGTSSVPRKERRTIRGGVRGPRGHNPITGDTCKIDWRSWAVTWRANLVLAHGIKPQFPNGIVSSVSFVSTTNTARALPGAFPYSITSSAVASSAVGTARPRVFAVFMLMTSLKRVGCSNGRSAGFAPLRTRSARDATRTKVSSRSGA